MTVLIPFMLWYTLFEEYPYLFCVIEEVMMMECYVNACKCGILELWSAYATLRLSASSQLCVGKFLQPVFPDEAYDVV